MFVRAGTSGFGAASSGSGVWEVRSGEVVVFAASVSPFVSASSQTSTRR